MSRAYSGVCQKLPNRIRVKFPKYLGGYSFAREKCIQLTKGQSGQLSNRIDGRSGVFSEHAKKPRNESYWRGDLPAARFVCNNNRFETRGLCVARRVLNFRLFRRTFLFSLPSSPSSSCTPPPPTISVSLLLAFARADLQCMSMTVSGRCRGFSAMTCP